MGKPAWACALGAILLWALFATLVRHAGTAPPLLLTGVALCCGSLASVHRWREWRVPAPVFGFGVASLFLYHACLVAAFQLAPIAEANLLNYLWPMLIVVLAACGPAGGGSGNSSGSDCGWRGIRASRWTIIRYGVRRSSG